ncbi:dTDP-glucose 4,6-dehydratase [Candidatus Gottesmanbacteria bacterium RIFCSPLOWO2_01_FULL_49_10]|uniref:dTDP-glucose 4,6-dehydratase n=1 Tax=Candidatus Gottesmanbacteria bacterium RIFCSPLOWO2_01_FULL_49_10 TaxID=1798396 RepID=A0A1F6AZM4_9BACT|nr:MAG: dTDP-glucose 4,6-dehydratase [Microgenomates group bacterium GW2011_GWA2_47_8]OGG29993.1 MAG: dTDP-glucose 4,6-dehydratase [Candidatus Gottesmanbacteria bacterium RIFCSPLOWO2_01_FULL_49_10]
MKLLVTGGAGFIGSNFILYWMKNYPEDEIVNVDKLTYAGNLDNLKSATPSPRYKFIHSDICDAVALREALVGVDTVVHFAAETHVDRSIMEPGAFVRTNVVGTHMLLEAALEARVGRFHHVSTDEVFGSLELGSTKKFSETTCYDPRSPYSASKAASDHLVRAYFHTYGLPVTITNCSNNYGPYQFPEKLIPLTITNILEEKKVPVYGDGKNIRDWLHVEDHCRAIDVVLRKGKIGETYCVGGLRQDVDNNAMVHKLIGLMGKDLSAIEFVKDRQGHDRRYAIDWTKIQRELGWSPLHDLDTWLVATVEWYTKNQDWWRRTKSGEYQSYYEKQYGAKQ